MIRVRMHLAVGAAVVAVAASMAGPAANSLAQASRATAASPEFIPAVEKLAGTNRAGFITTGATVYNQVIGVFTIPSITSCSGCDSQLSSWVGLGQGSADNDLLVQAGVDEDDNNGVKKYWGFYEMYAPGTDYTSETITPIPVSPGQKVYVSVDHTGSGEAHIQFDNETTRASYGFLTQWSSEYTIGNAAQWIAERPVVDSKYTTLANFGTESWTGSYADTSESGGTYTPIGDLSRDYIYMYSCVGSTTMAYTGNVNTADSTDFPIIWEKYGKVEYCNPNADEG